MRRKLPQARSLDFGILGGHRDRGSDFEDCFLRSLVKAEPSKQVAKAGREKS